MVETILLITIRLLFFGLVGITIINFALVILIVYLLHRQ